MLDQFDPAKSRVEFEASQSVGTRATNTDKSRLHVERHLAGTMARGFSPDIIEVAKAKEERSRTLDYLDGYTHVGDGQVNYDDVTKLVLKERKRHRRPADSSDDEEEDAETNPSLADDVRRRLELRAQAKKREAAANERTYGDVRKGWVRNVKGSDGTTLGRADHARTTSLDETGALQLRNLGYDKEVQRHLKRD